MDGVTRGVHALALAAATLLVAGCVYVPASIREDFAPLRPDEPSNFDPGPKGVAPAREAVGYAPGPTAPAPADPAPALVAPPATNASSSPASEGPRS